MRIGTRESKLAMRQTEIFCEKMAAMHPEIDLEVVGIKALGDKDFKSSISQMSAQGAFVKELDEALLSGEIDVSVNSLKDIPITVSQGLTIGAVFERDAVEDVILPMPIDELPEGARVGTSSIRRQHMLKEYRPDLEIVPLRGNIHTRMAKLDEGEYDAIVLAKAGLDRMGIERPMFILDKETFIPAPAQGVIAVECRKDDKETLSAISCLSHTPTRLAISAERGIMKLMGAGCSSPVGINAVVEGDMIRVIAVSYLLDDEVRRVDEYIPLDFVMDEILGIAEYLAGKRDVVI